MDTLPERRPFKMLPVFRLLAYDSFCEIDKVVRSFLLKNCFDSDPVGPKVRDCDIAPSLMLKFSARERVRFRGVIDKL